MADTYITLHMSFDWYKFVQIVFMQYNEVLRG